MRPGPLASAVEQADRGKAATANEARLVDPNKVQIEDRVRDLATFNLAIDSKLRGCDVRNPRRRYRCR